MADSNDSRGTIEEFIETISRVLSHVVNEPALIGKVEEFLSPLPANIFNNDDDHMELALHIHKFLDKFGQRVHVISMKEPRLQARIRTYPTDITNELTDSFHICRSSICRLHMFYITLECIQTRPEFWTNMTEESSRIYARALSRSFWDALEIATIRLASYWDRVGQLLDFVFFNIRQYERDGFPVVLERIKKNFASTFPEVVGDTS